MTGTRPARPEVRRRLLVMLCAGLVLLGHTLFGLASPAAACGCGGFVDPADRADGANVMKETSVLSLRDGVETIVMGLLLDAERVGSTLLMPTPSVPEVSAAQSGTLREMAAATAPREVIEYDYWGDGVLGAGSGADGGAPESTGAPQPTVHSQERIGNYEVAVLGGEAEGVRDWLTENGYSLSPELSPLIDPYAEEGWTFTAVRYAEDAVLSGDVEPLRFEFATEQLIYPMRFSQAAETTQRVHLYVLSETPVRRTDAGTGAQQSSREWIGDPTRHDWTWSDATLRELVGEDLGETAQDQAEDQGENQVEEPPVRHGVVTAFEIRGEPESFTTDLAFTSDPEAEDVIPTYTTTEVVTVVGIPVGWLLVLAGLITASAVLVAILAVLRPRRAPDAARPSAS